MTPTGLEHPSDSIGKPENPQGGGAESGALGAEIRPAALHIPAYLVDAAQSKLAPAVAIRSGEPVMSEPSR
jgi:hypothetical protein